MSEVQILSPRPVTDESGPVFFKQGFFYGVPFFNSLAIFLTLLSLAVFHPGLYDESGWFKTFSYNSGDFPMVFFTSILIVAVFYYLQTDGLIYITIIAVVAELINIFLTHTATRSVEKKADTKYGKLIEGYKAKIASHQKKVKELEGLQEEAVKKIYTANLKIREYEEKLSTVPAAPCQPDIQPKKISPSQKPPREKFMDLPPGSNRKQPPI